MVIFIQTKRLSGGEFPVYVVKLHTIPVVRIRTTLEFLEKPWEASVEEWRILTVTRLNRDFLSYQIESFIACYEVNHL